MTVETVILAVTLSGMTPQGKVEVSVMMDFHSRAECLAHVDDRIKILRQRLKPPYGMSITAFCDVRGKQ